MSDIELKNKLESVLFSMGKKVSLEELSKLCKENDLGKIKSALELLKQELDAKASSLMLVEEAEHYKLAVREKYLSIVRKVVSKTELAKSVLETLAVIAFKAPVLQSQVIRVRTNKAYDHLRHLEETGYITREKKGRTKLIKLTQKFFDYFDIPADKLKERFGNVSQVEHAIATKEQELAIAQQTQVVKDAEQKVGELEVYDADAQTQEAKEPTPSPLEPYGATIGTLEVYTPPKEKRKKQQQEISEEPAETSEAVDVTPQEISAEVPKEPMPAEAPEATPEEASEPETATTDAVVEEIEKEGEKAAAALRKEVEEEKPRREFAGKGLFAEGMPATVQERVEQRVSELLRGEKKEKTEEEAPAEEAQESEPESAEEPKEGG